MRWVNVVSMPKLTNQSDREPEVGGQEVLYLKQSRITLWHKSAALFL